MVSVIWSWPVEFHTRVATGMIANVESPLEQLSKPHRQKPKLVKKVEPVS